VRARNDGEFIATPTLARAMLLFFRKNRLFIVTSQLLEILGTKPPRARRK
jgi:hypothetical protein